MDNQLETKVIEIEDFDSKCPSSTFDEKGKELQESHPYIEPSSAMKDAHTQKFVPSQLLEEADYELLSFQIPTKDFEKFAGLNLDDPPHQSEPISLPPENCSGNILPQEFFFEDDEFDFHELRIPMLVDGLDKRHLCNDVIDEFTAHKESNSSNDDLCIKEIDDEIEDDSSKGFSDKEQPLEASERTERANALGHEQSPQITGERGIEPNADVSSSPKKIAISPPKLKMSSANTASSSPDFLLKNTCLKQSVKKEAYIRKTFYFVFSKSGEFVPVTMNSLNDSLYSKESMVTHHSFSLEDMKSFSVKRPYYAAGLNEEEYSIYVQKLKRVKKMKFPYQGYSSHLNEKSSSSQGPHSELLNPSKHPKELGFTHESNSLTDSSLRRLQTTVSIAVEPLENSCGRSTETICSSSPPTITLEDSAEAELFPIRKPHNFVEKSSELEMHTAANISKHPTCEARLSTGSIERRTLDDFGSKERRSVKSKANCSSVICKKACNRPVLEPSVPKCFVVHFQDTKMKTITSQSIEISEEGNYKCFHCDLAFEDRYAMFVHLEAHLENRIFHCIYCGINFEIAQDYIKHRKLHKECRICFNTCDSEFISKYSYNVHKSNHLYACRSKELEVNLEDEHVSFSNEDSQRHLDQRLVDCRFCCKTFNDISHLQHHETMHVKKPFKCTLCKKMFNDRNSLTRHCRKHSYKGHFCIICSEKFQYKESLRCHIIKGPCKEMYENYQHFISLPQNVSKTLHYGNVQQNLVCAHEQPKFCKLPPYDVSGSEFIQYNFVLSSDDDSNLILSFS